MAKKTLEKCFSAKFARAVARVVREHGSDGGCTTREEVAAELAGNWTATSDSLLTMLVGEVVRAGEATGIGAKRGRDGGLYHIASRERALAETE